MTASPSTTLEKEKKRSQRKKERKRKKRGKTKGREQPTRLAHPKAFATLLTTPSFS